MRPNRAACARLDDYQLTFDLGVGPGERGAANLRFEKDSCVYGVAYWLDYPDLSRLDRSEGVHRGVYVRKRVRLSAGNEAIEAFTYMSIHRTPGRLPSRRYINLILRGARHHRLPKPYIDALAAIPLAHDEREEEQQRLL